ncbi:MAG: KpsF/GutQ family sugar-phosphate isomerase [Saprospiraceae bacterium]|nr:KpsF/GutQ family sugar-phosphate isomerase [Saprospiraceae bacterium]
MKNLILTTAERTLQIELNALEALKSSFDDDFVRTVEIIYQSKGRVILTGIGKSAIVAQKIVATLNSTGTPSVFMHAADAIHGDLGIIQPHDILICLSKSGETPEIKVLVPLLKNFGNTLIAMVANRDSYLGKQAHHILYTPIEIEADPNNLAPTSSTTSQMVMGDALATSLLALRGFSSAHFAQLHPGGALGKQLYLRVSDIYPMHGTPSVSMTTNLKNTILEMTSKRLGATAVLDENHHLKGIITDGDLRRLLIKDVDLKTVTAAEVMTPNPQTIDSESLAVEALKLMRERSITQLIATEGGHYVGMVHLHDLVREGLL